MDNRVITRREFKDRLRSDYLSLRHVDFKENSRFLIANVFKITPEKLAEILYVDKFVWNGNGFIIHKNGNVIFTSDIEMKSYFFEMVYDYIIENYTDDHILFNTL